MCKLRFSQETEFFLCQKSPVEKYRAGGAFFG